MQWLASYNLDLLKYDLDTQLGLVDFFKMKNDFQKDECYIYEEQK